MPQPERGSPLYEAQEDAANQFGFFFLRADEEARVDKHYISLQINRGDFKPNPESGMYGNNWSMAFDGTEHPPKSVELLATDIQTWFDPKQQWRIVNIGFGMQDTTRRDAIFKQQPTNERPGTIDQYMLYVQLRSPNPPMKNDSREKRKVVDILKALSPRFEGDVRLGRSWYDLYPRKVHKIMKIDKAHSPLPDRLHLQAVAVWPTFNSDQRQMPKENANNPIKYTDVAVIVLIKDLKEYLVRTQELVQQLLCELDIQEGTHPHLRDMPTW